MREPDEGADFPAEEGPRWVHVEAGDVRNAVPGVGEILLLRAWDVDFLGLCWPPAVERKKQ
jgi:hypothetical protein